jgi:ABC-type nitrate/sulfonate/bicarbonate transport system permease component
MNLSQEKTNVGAPSIEERLKAPPASRRASQKAHSRSIGAWAVSAAVVVAWASLSSLELLPDYVFPSLAAVLKGYQADIRSGRLFNDVIASLYRVFTAFALTVVLAVPTGLWLGQVPAARKALLPPC